MFLTANSQPDRMPTTSWIFRYLLHNAKTMGIEQCNIFIVVQAGMIKRFTLEAAQRNAMGRPTGKHQRSTRLGMGLENREHSTLILRRQMKETVPRQNASETLFKRQLAHVGHMPIVLRKTLPTQGDHRHGRIDASHSVSRADQVTRHGFGTATADVEDMTSRNRHGQAKMIQPGLFDQTPRANTIPCLSVTFVEIDDLMGCFMHEGQSLGDVVEV
ncbi:hypothetical protein BSF40_36000 [Pseudomonas sp. ACN5]|nr:hypothetical protein BSF40_36000 [Pseudomonas sp. ACN5]